MEFPKYRLCPQMHFKKANFTVFHWGSWWFWTLTLTPFPLASSSELREWFCLFFRGSNWSNVGSFWSVVSLSLSCLVSTGSGLWDREQLHLQCPGAGKPEKPALPRGQREQRRHNGPGKYLTGDLLRQSNRLHFHWLVGLGQCQVFSWKETNSNVTTHIWL